MFKCFGHWGAGDRTCQNCDVALRCQNVIGSEKKIESVEIQDPEMLERMLRGQVG